MLFSLSCTREVKEIKTVTEPKDSVIVYYTPLGISDADLELGREVFKKYCGCCHSFDRFVGAPQLVYRDDYEFVFHRRMPNYSYWYIMNSDSLYESGDPWAWKMKTDYPNNKMPSFNSILNDAEVKSVVNYINYRTTNK